MKDKRNPKSQYQNTKQIPMFKNTKNERPMVFQSFVILRFDIV